MSVGVAPDLAAATRGGQSDCQPVVTRLDTQSARWTAGFPRRTLGVLGSAWPARRRCPHVRGSVRGDLSTRGADGADGGCLAERKANAEAGVADRSGGLRRRIDLLSRRETCICEHPTRWLISRCARPYSSRSPRIWRSVSVSVFQLVSEALAVLGEFESVVCVAEQPEQGHPVLVVTTTGSIE